MENKYNIGIISKTLNIPRSTLRYWEKEGLISSNRNFNNDYRQFSLNSIYEILDIAFYRKLNISIKEIKKMETQNVKEIEQVLLKNKKNIDKTISELKNTKKMIEKRINQIKIFYDLTTNPYQICESIDNTNRIIEFDIKNKDILSLYLNYPENFVLYKERNKDVEYGFILNDKKYSYNVIWEKENNENKYAKFILKQNYYNLSTDIKTHIKNLNDRGYKTGNVIAKYLLTDFEGDKFDYYEAYMEIKKDL